MNYLTFIDDKPVTGIPFLDEMVQFEYDVGLDTYKGKFVSGSLSFNVELRIDDMLLVLDIPKAYLTFQVGYGDSETFHEIVYNFDELFYKVGDVDVFIELSSVHTSIHINDNSFKTYISNNMPKDKFLEKTKLVIESLVHDIGKDIISLSNFANNYNSAMICRTKSAL